MADKILNTRLKLKYDTLTNWLSKDPVLLAGEVAVATIATTESNSGLTPPAVSLRIGDGKSKFSELNWIQAIAGDVQAWAKDDGATVRKWINDEIKNIPAAASGAGTTDFTAGKLISQITQDEGGKITGIEYADITQDDVSGLTNALSTINTNIAAKLDKNLASTNATATNVLIDTAAVSKNIDTAKAALLGTGGIGGTHTIKGAYDAAAAVASTVASLDMESKAVAEQFIDSIKQEDGKVSVTRASVSSKLSIDGTYSSDNKLATVSTVAKAIKAYETKLQDHINAITSAMRFRGTLTEAPTSATAAPSDDLGAWRAGDVVLYGTAEYVVSAITNSNPTWQLLGDEGAYQTKLSFTGTYSSTNKVVTNDTLEAAKTALNASITEANTATGAAKDAADAAQTNATSALNKIAALDVTDAQATGTGVVSAVTQTDGKIAVTKKTLKISDISDLSFNTAVSSTNKAASMSDVGAAITALDSTISTTKATDNSYYVLTGITQASGKLTDKTQVQLAAIAKTGNVNDLVQTSGDTLILDCGNATV